jgi:hypothetical protein
LRPAVLDSREDIWKTRADRVSQSLSEEGGNLMAAKPQDREQEIRIRALRDERFRHELLRQPVETLEREYGVRVPDGWKIQVHEESEGTVHLVIPGRLLPNGTRITDDMLDDTIAESLRATTSCCTCGSTTEQSLSSLQAGCGC